VGELERQANTEREQRQSAEKRAATAEAENEVLKKRVAELDGTHSLTPAPPAWP
jgi:hypothetical protein